MKKNLRSCIVFAVLFSTIIMLCPVYSCADTGPKPSVCVSFKGLGDELCYGTLLSDRESTGPASAWDGIEGHETLLDGNLDVWKAMEAYKDPDGFYFLQWFWQINETKELNWTYYPPNTFKIMLYFPESNTFYVSDIYERYAFDSYYSVDMRDYNVTEGKTVSISAERSYDYSREILAFASRVVLTVAIELAVALLFGYKNKKQLRLITAVNIITQILLNILLNIVNYRSGPWTAIVWYTISELTVFGIEAAVYAVRLGKLGEKTTKKSRAILYALIANLASFILGRYLIRIL